MVWCAEVVKINGRNKCDDFLTQEKAQLWVLRQVETGIKKSVIVNKKNEEKFVINWGK